MRDGYRYFVSYPTGEDGKPAIEHNDPGYFRVGDLTHSPSLPTGRIVEYWTNSGSWLNAYLQPFGRFIDDVLRSGATVREIHDEKELPRA